MVTTAMQKIPFLALDREFEENRAAYTQTVNEVLSAGWLLQGPQIQQLETTVAEACNRRYAIAVGSCTDALFLALKAADIGAGDEVLVTDFSFVSSASAIVRAGASPVFVEIGDDYQMDLRDAQRRLTARTRALVCVHLYGQMTDPHTARRFCEEHGLLLIEDAAQSFGACRDGSAAGSLGMASCLSFDPTKVIAAPGSGGMVLTDDPDVGQRVKRLRYHGKSASGEITELGYNSQMSCLSAALLMDKLARHVCWLARRRRLAKFYDEHLPEELARLPNQAGAKPVFHKYVVSCGNRDGLLRHLQQTGIECRVDFIRPLHQEPLFRAHADPDAFPKARRASQRVISLPMHAFLTDGEAERVVCETKRFFSRRARCAA